MRRALWVLSGLLLVAGCGEDVPVGGRDEGADEGDGEPATGVGDGDGDGDGADGQADGDDGTCRELNGERICDGTGGDAGSGDDDGADVDAGIATEDPIGDAISHARDDIRCRDASDCCVVIDPCRGLALVVPAEERSLVRTLIDGADPVDCVRCGPTLVQVTCEASVCVGTSIAPREAGSGLDDPLAADHCGTLPASGTETDTGHLRSVQAGRWQRDLRTIDEGDPGDDQGGDDGDADEEECREVDGREICQPIEDPDRDDDSGGDGSTDDDGTGRR